MSFFNVQAKTCLSGAEKLQDWQENVWPSWILAMCIFRLVWFKKDLSHLGHEWILFRCLDSLWCWQYIKSLKRHISHLYLRMLLSNIFLFSANFWFDLSDSCGSVKLSLSTSLSVASVPFLARQICFLSSHWDLKFVLQILQLNSLLFILLSRFDLHFHFPVFFNVIIFTCFCSFCYFWNYLYSHSVFFFILV